MEIIIALILIGGILTKVIFLGGSFLKFSWYLLHCLTFGRLIENKNEKETYRSLGVGIYILIGFVVLIIVVFKVYSLKH